MTTEQRYRELVDIVKHDCCAAGGPLEQAIFEWIKKMCSTQRAAYIEYVDSGYDFSSYGRKTNDPMPINEFNTIADFLEYPTGETIPTYESGYGFTCETYNDLIFYEVNDFLHDWLFKQEWYSEIFDDEEECIHDDFLDELTLASVNEFAIIDDLSQKPFPKLKEDS